jgi:peroxiredoxin Q/BCP
MASRAGKDRPDGLQAGDRAPDFTLVTDTDGTLTRASLKGRPYIVYFYPKDNTTGCTREAVDFTAAARTFAKLGIPVLGVSKDSLASHEKFRSKHKLNVILGSDPDIKMAQAWKVWGEKILYGRKYMGMERATFLVDDKGVIAAAWHKVKVPGHVEAVLSAAKSL